MTRFIARPRMIEAVYYRETLESAEEAVTFIREHSDYDVAFSVNYIGEARRVGLKVRRPRGEWREIEAGMYILIEDGEVVRADPDVFEEEWMEPPTAPLLDNDKELRGAHVAAK